MIIVGIDPGLTGGYAALDAHGHAEAYKFESFSHFEEVFGSQNIGLCVLEKVHSSPAMGVSSSFTFGENFGGWKATLEILRIPYELVTPNLWQRKILGNFPAGESKQRAVEFAQKKWPQLNIKKSHTGIADSLCMALYGQRFLQNEPLRT